MFSAERPPQPTETEEEASCTPLRPLYLSLSPFSLYKLTDTTHPESRRALPRGEPVPTAALRRSVAHPRHGALLALALGIRKSQR